ncbi:centromere/kinetochore protein zw10 homolog, partial [Hyalella azteca]|uniref:Centromere/kinetochore protein zw10 homolog n=1 Tax=Hyalella azteca TaxID=294128 RepID=A0A979FKV4_HYAAZ
MALVADVLASIKKRSGVEGSSASGDGVCVEVAVLAKRAVEAKLAVIQALNGRYVQLSSALQDTSLLQARVEVNEEQLHQLKTTLDSEVSPSVAQSVEAVTGVAAHLQQAEEGLAIAQQLLAVHDALREAGDHNIAARFYDAAIALNKADAILATITPDIEILPGILEEVMVQRNNLIYTLSQIWSKSYQWKEEQMQNEQKKSITLLIRNWDKCKQEALNDLEENQLLDINQVSSALYVVDELHLRMAVFGSNLMKNFFKVLVSRPARVSLKDSGDYYALSITFSTAPLNKSSNKHNMQPSPHEVFTSCEQVLKCLYDSGFSSEFDASAVDTSGVTASTSLMTLLGQEISETFTRLLINECLACAVPTSRKNLDQFDEVKLATEAFHAKLVRIGFYNKSERSILEYAANVDTVFSDRACAHLLDTARDLVCQPLHNTVTIAHNDEYPPLVLQDLLPQ